MSPQQNSNFPPTALALFVDALRGKSFGVKHSQTIYNLTAHESRKKKKKKKKKTKTKMSEIEKRHKGEAEEEGEQGKAVADTRNNSDSNSSNSGDGGGGDNGDAATDSISAEHKQADKDAEESTDVSSKDAPFPSRKGVLLLPGSLDDNWLVLCFKRVSGERHHGDRCMGRERKAAVTTTT